MDPPSSRSGSWPAWPGRRPGDGPLDAVACGLAAAAAMLGEFRRDLSRQRHAVIAANPELRERELAKLADYAAAVAGALRHRGVGEPQATPGRRSRHDGACAWPSSGGRAGTTTGTSPTSCGIPWPDYAPVVGGG